MVAIVSGKGTGLQNSSAKLIGQDGVFGNAATGSSGEGAYINVANGNLVLQDQDDFVAASGLDLALTRTYNSQGSTSDGVGPSWKLGVAKKLAFSGPLGVAGSTLTRTDGDGSMQLYVCDANGNYVTSDGGGAYQSVTQAGNGDWIWRSDHKLAAGLTETYDSNGRLKIVNDEVGARLTYSYNAAGQVQQITDATGDTTYFDFTNGNLTQVRTRLAGTSTDFVRTSYAYDTSNRLWQVSVDLTPANKSDALSYTTTYGYDGTSNRISSITQSDGTTVNFAYVISDSDYKVARVTTSANGASRTVGYDYSVAGQTAVTDPLGATTIYMYETNTASTSYGQLTRVIEAAGTSASATTVYSYDPNGSLKQITSPTGGITTFGYDGNRNQNKVIDAAGNTITRVFDANSNALLNETVKNYDATPPATGAVQKTALYAYDALGRVRFTLTPEQRLTESQYNANGDLVRTIQYPWPMAIANIGANTTLTEASFAAYAAGQPQANRTVTDYVYDARGLLSRTTTYTATDASGNPFDSTGKPLAPPEVTVYVYDQAGLLLSKTDTGAANTVTYTYDGLGRLLTARDVNLQTISSSVYDDAHHTVTTTTASGLTTTSVYDSVGELVSITRTGANVTMGTSTYKYDADGRLVMAVDPNGVRTFTLYDADGRKSADVDGDGTVTEYFYDGADNLTRIRVYANRIDTSTLVDASGNYLNKTLDQIRPAANAATDRSTWHVYNSVNQLVDTVDPEGRRVHYEYVLGQVVKTTEYATHVSVAVLDGTNAPTAASVAVATTSADRITRSFYDKDNNLVGTLDPVGKLIEYRYDGAGRKIDVVTYQTVVTAADGASLASICPADDYPFHARFLYDAAGRMVGAADNDGYLTEYTYSAAGNLMRKKKYGYMIDTTFADNATLASVRPAWASADDHQIDYEYNELDQLKREVDGGSAGTVTTYTYDKAGNLATKRVGAASDPQSGAQYRYDGRGNIIAELSPIGMAQIALGANVETVWAQYATKYTYDAGGRRITATEPATANEPNGNRTLYYYDGDGRLVYTVNALGQVTQTDYNAFGQVQRTVQYAHALDLATVIPVILAGGAAATLSGAVNALADAANDAVTAYAYDREGNLTDKTDGVGYHTLLTYDEFGEVTGTFASSVKGSTAANGTAEGYSRTFYDAGGRVTLSVGGAGNVTEYKYDVNGNVTEKIGYANTISTALLATATQASVRALITPDRVHDFHEICYYGANNELSATLTAQGIVNGVLQWAAKDYNYDAFGGLSSTYVHATMVSSNAPTAADRMVLFGAGTRPKIIYMRDSQGRIVATVEATGTGSNEWSVSTQEYDAVGNVVAKTEYATTYSSMSSLSVAQFIANYANNTSNHVTRYVYNQANQLVTTAVAQGVEGGNLAWSLTSYTYDKAGRLTTQTELATKLSSSNLPSSKTAADYRTWITNGAAVASTQDRTTRFGYDALNRLTVTIDATGAVSGRMYDAKGNVVRTTAYATLDKATTVIPNGYNPAVAAADRVTRTVYDQDNRAVFTIDALGGVTEYRYDARGNVAKTIAYAVPLTLPSLTEPLRQADVTPVATSADRITRQVFDQAGRPRFSSDALGYVTETQYDGAGRVIKTIAYDTNPVIADGAPLATWAGAVAGAANRTKQYEYDADGNLVKFTDVDTKFETYTYDGRGNRLTYTNKAGSKWSYQYDAAGRMVQETTPKVAMYANSPYVSTIGTTWDATHALTTASVVTRISYDAFGNVTSRTEAYGTAQQRVTRYFYDDVGRQVQTVLPSVRVYDGSIDQKSSLFLTTADPQGRFEKDSGELSIVVTYNAFGDAIANKDVGGNVSEKAYDKLGRVVYERDALKNITEYQYDQFGGVQKLIRRANSYIGSMAAAPATIGAAIGTSALDRTITTYYDALGRAIKTVEPAGYIYDPAAGMSAPVLAARTVETEYDTYGDTIHRLTYGDTGGTRIASENVRYYYDRRGEKTADLSVVREAGSGQPAQGYLTVYTYSPAGLQTTQTEYANSIALYGDVRDNTTYATPVASVQDRSTRVDYDAMGRKKAETRYGYVNAGGTIVADNANAAVTSYTYDYLGNQTSVTDAVGGTTYTNYDVLGRVIGIKKVQTVPQADIVAATAGTPLTEFKLDVFGNVLLRIDYAQGAANGSATDFTAKAPTDTENHKTATVYDSAGRAVQVIKGVEGTESGRFTPVMTYTSYDAFGRVVKQWTPFKDNDNSDDTKKTVRNTFTVTNYDALGRVLSTVTPANVDNVNMFDSNWISTVTSNTYDVFGELTRQTLDDGRNPQVTLQQTSYDQAGHAWRSTAGDAVTKVMLYDVRGDVTSTIRSGGTTNANPLDGLASVADVFSQKNLLRTDTTYDLLGHATSVANVTDLAVLRWTSGPMDWMPQPYSWTESGSGVQPDDLLIVSRPDEANKAVTLVYRRVGDTAWTTASADRLQTVGGYRVFSTAGLASGDYEFQVSTQGVGEAAYTSARGTVTVTAGTSSDRALGVIRLYTVLLNRAPSSHELNLAMTRMNNGATLAGIAQSILDSAEALAYLGTTDTTTGKRVLTGDSVFTRIYADAFGNTSASNAPWRFRFEQGAGPGGTDRGQVIVAMINDLLAPANPASWASSIKPRIDRRTTVLGAYLIDGQGGDQAVLKTLLTQCDDPSLAGTSTTDLANNARDKALNDTYAVQLTQMYLAMFGRAPDPKGYAFWLSALTGKTNTIDKIVTDWFTSPEATSDPTLYPTTGLTAAQINEQLVAHAYQNMVGRLPTAAEKAAWLGALNGTSGTPVTKSAFLLQLAQSIASYSGSDTTLLRDQQLFNNRIAVGMVVARMTSNGSPMDISVAAARLVTAAVGPDGSPADAAAAAAANLQAASNSAALVKDAVAKLGVTYDVASANSAESARDKISRMYIILFGRAVDAGNLAFYSAPPPTTAIAWIQIANRLLTSNEGKTGYGAAYKLQDGTPVARSDSEFVQRLYELAFNQQPLQPTPTMSAEMARLVQRIPAEGRGAIVMAVVNGVLNGGSLTPAEQALKDTYDNRAAVGVAFATDLGLTSTYARATIDMVTATDVQTALTFAYTKARPQLAYNLGGFGNNAQVAADTMDIRIAAAQDYASSDNNPALATAALNGTANANDLMSLVQIYVGLFGRDPDQVGLKFWFSALSPTNTVAQIAQTMFKDAASRYPSTLSNEDFLKRVYASILGDINNPQPLSTWPSGDSYLWQLNSGSMQRQQVWYEVLKSVIGFNSTGVTAAGAYVLQARSAFFARVKDAMARVASAAHAEYDPLAVQDQAYLAQVKSLQDKLAASTYTTDLNTSKSNMQTANAAGDGLGDLRLRLTMLYTMLLQRTSAPTLGEIQKYTWPAPSDPAAALKQAAADLIASAGLGGLSNSDFVKEIYLRVLQRPLVAADGTYWVDQLNKGITRAAAVVDILKDYLNYTDFLSWELHNKAAFDARIDGMLSTLKSTALTVLQAYSDRTTATAIAAQKEYDSWVALVGAHPSVTKADTSYETARLTMEDLATLQANAPAGDAQAAALKPYIGAIDAVRTAAPVNAAVARSIASQATEYVREVYDVDGYAQQVQQITQLYTAIVGTAPTLSALKFWMDSIMYSSSSMDDILDNIAAGIMAGPEAAAVNFQTGMSNEAFVTRLYQTALGRAPDANGLQFWMGALSSGTSRARMVNQWIASLTTTKNMADTIVFDQRVKQRLNEIFNASTSFALATTTAPVDVSLTDYTSARAVNIYDAAGRSGVAGNADSTYVLRAARLYVALFDRAPDALGLANLVNAMVANPGRTDAQFADQLLASGEASTLYPSSMSMASFATAIAGRVLGRAPTAAELSSYAALSRGTVAARIIAAAASPGIGLTQQESATLFNDKVVAAFNVVAANMAAFIAAVPAASTIAAQLKAANPVDVHTETIATAISDRVLSASIGQVATVYTTDRWGNVLTMTDPRDANWITTYTYNTNNQLLATTTPFSAVNSQVKETAVTSTAYDKLGRVVSTTDARNNTTGYQYDTNGNVVNETHADGGIVRSSYDLFGQRLTVTQPGVYSVTMAYRYDHFGNLTQVDTGTKVDSYTMDGVSTGTPNLTLVYVRTSSVVMAYAYDELGRRISAQDGTLQTTKWQYDVSGNVVSQTDALGNISYDTYDAMGHMVAQVDALGTHRQTWTYDTSGRLTGHANLERKGSTPATYTWSSTLTTGYTYDNAGRLFKQTSDGGQSLTYSYMGDELRSITDAGSDSAQVTNYTYDRAGNRTTESITYGSITRTNVNTYDLQNRLTSSRESSTIQDDTVYSVAFAYDKNGNRTMTHTEYDQMVSTGGGSYMPSVWKSQHVSYHAYNSYDTMNRQLVVNGILDTDGKTVILGSVDPGIGIIGHKLTYDQGGNRLTDTYQGAVLSNASGKWTASSTSTSLTTENYSYDDAGRLSTVTRDGLRIDTRYYDGAGRVLESGMLLDDAGNGTALIAYRDQAALAALQWSAGLSSQHMLYAYDGNGHVIRQVTRGIDKTLNGDVYLVHDQWNPVGGYDADGNLTGYTSIDIANSGKSIIYRTTYKFRDGAALEDTASVEANGSTNYTRSEYDVNGNRKAVYDALTGGSVRTSARYDALGHVRQKTDSNGTTFSMVVNDRVLGVEDKRGANVMGMTYTSMTDQTANQAASFYTVQGSETLSTIAQTLWGDANLWFLIADANGLSLQSTLTKGQMLRIPERASTVHNTADTFKPYSANEAIGDTSPIPPPPTLGSSCGEIKTMIEIFVVVVVVAVVAQWSAQALAKAAPEIFAASSGAGAGAGSATVPVAAEAGAGAGAAAAAAAAYTPNALAMGIGGAAGSVAGQTVSIGFGLQNGYNWRAVAAAAIGGAVSGALNGTSIFSDMNPTAAAAARAALSNTISQGIGIATGLQHGFDWRAVAGSAASASLGTLIGDQKVANAGFGTLMARGIVGGTTSSILRGGKVELVEILGDAFGNALGNSLAEQTSPTSAPAKSFSDSIDRGPDWLQKWKAADSGVNGLSNSEFDDITRQAIAEGQSVAGDGGGSAGGKRSSGAGDPPTATDLQKQADQLNGYNKILSRAADEARARGDSASATAYQEQINNNYYAASAYQRAALNVGQNDQIGSATQSGPSNNDFGVRRESVVVYGEAYSPSVAYISPAAITPWSSSLDMTSDDTRRYVAAEQYNAERTMNVASLGLAGLGTAVRVAEVGTALWSESRVFSTSVPYGFSSTEDFFQFGNNTRAGLLQAGYSDVEPLLQGSAVTGKSFRTGQAFDVGRVSDFDVALASQSMLDRAAETGIGLRSAGTRTGPLSPRDLRVLGLDNLANFLSQQAGRDVNFMVYKSAAGAAQRAPSIVLPK